MVTDAYREIFCNCLKHKKPQNEQIFTDTVGSGKYPNVVQYNFKKYR
jgi:hypothetical protein